MWARITTGRRPAPLKLPKDDGRVFKGAGDAISKSGESVAEELAFFIHEGKDHSAQGLRVMGKL